MSRLRALLKSTTHRSGSVRVDAHLGRESAMLGGVDRRRLLGLLGAAPIAAPALARAALAPEPFSQVIFYDVNGSYAAALARYHSELDAWAESVQVWRDGPLPAPPQFRMPPGAAVPRLGGRWPLPAVAPCAFLDDVGSGP